MIALQALSMYNVRTYARELDMRLTLETSTNSTFYRELTLTQDDVEIEKSVGDVSIVTVCCLFVGLCCCYT